ncbi:hypothetical protein [Kibdelosporangium phytohabitans]|uniref:Uncharacterized protein n=1 Tax=Kibdelosporangium phytohabitans TaxID=860235 RepID=A0A0N9HQT1_9PSEU|nr:hypothetical protein [Kibdelosporangium phytohabitans]ALG07121.1 hypothetical protein AOZ06_09460 [Kibdelosporangium phytohabitans]MBE1468440.1 hypothetical protein [Kibdelosporangium phytohabitans]
MQLNYKAAYRHGVAEAAQGMALFRRLANVTRSGVVPEPAALDSVDERYKSLLHYWQPTPEAYTTSRLRVARTRP